MEFWKYKYKECLTKAGNLNPTLDPSIKEEIFIYRAKEIHKDKYLYFKVEYINNKTPVIIICPIHGNFEQKPDKHLSGQGCPTCAGTKKLTTKEFIERSKKSHNNKYLYNKARYVSNNIKLCITCPIHGDFFQTPAMHMQGQGCPVCAGNQKLTTKQFIDRANKKHNGLYSYNEVIYTNSLNKITITCPVHGNFNQNAMNHLTGTGCPACSGQHHDTLYVMRVVGLENVYKIGITRINLIEKRLNKLKKALKSYDVLLDLELVTAYQFKDPQSIETKILCKYDKVFEKSNPFEGYSEYILVTDEQELLNLIKIEKTLAY